MRLLASACTPSDAGKEISISPVPITTHMNALYCYVGTAAVLWFVVPCCACCVGGGGGSVLEGLHAATLLSGRRKEDDDDEDQGESRSNVAMPEVTSLTPPAGCSSSKKDRDAMPCFPSI